MAQGTYRLPLPKCMIGSPTDSERMWQFQHTGMAHKNAHTYRFVQELESSVLLRDLSKDPNNYSVSVKRCVKELLQILRA